MCVGDRMKQQHTSAPKACMHPAQKTTHTQTAQAHSTLYAATVCACCLRRCKHSHTRPAACTRTRLKTKQQQKGRGACMRRGRWAELNSIINPIVDPPCPQGRSKNTHMDASLALLLFACIGRTPLKCVNGGGHCCWVLLFGFGGWASRLGLRACVRACRRREAKAAVQCKAATHTTKPTDPRHAHTYTHSPTTTQPTNQPCRARPSRRRARARVRVRGM